MTNLRDNLSAFFNEPELQKLAYELGVDYENLQGDTKELKAQALIQFLTRRDRLNELIELVAAQRPHVVWSEFTATSYQSVRTQRPQVFTTTNPILTIIITAIVVLIATIAMLFVGMRAWSPTATLTNRENQTFGKRAGDFANLTPGSTHEFYSGHIVVSLNDVTDRPHHISADILTSDGDLDRFQCTYDIDCRKDYIVRDRNFKVIVDDVLLSTDPTRTEYIVVIWVVSYPSRTK